MPAKKRPDHLFYGLYGTNPGQPFSVRAGIYGVSTGFLYREKNIDCESTWLDTLTNILCQFPNNNVHILVYIHGYLAENPWFAALSGYTLHREIFDQEIHDVSLVISLQWDSGLHYSQNRLLAIEKGQIFRTVLTKLNERALQAGKKTSFSFLLHSMGNIVFEGLVQGITKDKKPWNIRQVFCCAADLESAIFNKGLRYLPEIASDVHVLFHAKDKTLRVADWMQNFRRLGIYGREDRHTAKNIHSLDCTLLSGDDTAVGSRFSHHRYFYGSKNVVKYINNWLRRL